MILKAGSKVKCINNESQPNGLAQPHLTINKIYTLQKDSIINRDNEIFYEIYKDNGLKSELYANRFVPYHESPKEINEQYQSRILTKVAEIKALIKERDATLASLKE